jgi:AcrR family transcriptional regulator
MKNARARVMQAAAAIVVESGISGVTYEAVAARAQMTRSGVVYHFPAKQQLIAGAHEHFAEQWHEETAARLSTSFEDADVEARLRAYVQQHAVVAHEGLVEVLAQMTGDRASREVWSDIEGRWAPLPDFDDPAGVRHLIARLAAHGLWLHQIVREPRLTEAQVRVVLEAIDDLLIRSGAPPHDPPS